MTTTAQINSKRNNYLLVQKDKCNTFIHKNYSSALEGLLASAKGCIYKIQSYCKTNIKSSSKNEDSSKNHVVDLSNPGNVYYPSVDQLEDLQKIIYDDRDSELSLNEHRNIFTRSNKSSASLKKEIELALCNVFDPLHTDKEYSLLAKSLGFSESDLASIIYHLLNSKLNKYLLSSHEATDLSVTYTETYTALCEDIGNSLFDNYLLNLSLLSPLLAKKLINIDDFKLIQLKSLFKRILEGAITKKDYLEFGLQVANTYHFYLLNYKLNKIIIKLSLAENINFYDVTAVLKRSTKAELNFLLQSLTEENKKYVIRLGALLVNQLVHGGILQKKMIFKGPKTISMVELAKHLDYDACFPTSYHKPLLHLYNKPTDFAAIVGDLSVNLREDDRIVHNNVISYGTPIGFLKDSTILNSTLTIDRAYYINIFLPILDHFIGKQFENFSENDRKNAFRFLQIYNIDFETLYLENCTSPKNLKIFTVLFNTALNFNIIYTTQTKHLFDTNKEYRPFKGYYYKIYTYKFFLWGFFHELEIYSQFKYFIVTKFFSSIGRYFTLSHSLTLQGHNIIRAFVKFLPVRTVTESDFSWFKSCVVTIIKDVEVQQEVSAIDFSTYNAKSKNLAFDSIYKHFDSNTPKEEVRKFLENYSSLAPQQQYTYVVDNIKKKDQAFSVLGLIHNYMYVLDASQSSYQIGFCDFRGSKESGILCNVLGESTSDLYQFCVDCQLDDIKALENSLGIFCKESLNLTLERLIQMPSLSIVSRYSTPQFDTFDFSTLIEHLILSNRNSYGYSDYLKKIIELFPSYGINGGIALNLFEYNWILDQRGQKHVKKLLESTLSYDIKHFLITLYYLRGFILFRKLLAKYPWLEKNNVIFNRNFYKPIIMPTAYGNTIYGRKQALLNHLKKKSMEHGTIIHNKRQTRDLRSLCILCETFFQKFMRIHLKETAKLLGLAKYLSETVTKPLSFETLYFKWDFFPYKKKKGKRIVVKNSFGKPVKLSLSKTLEILSKSDVARKLPAYYTHSHDGFQVHAFLYRMLSLKALLEERGYVVYFSSNHDGFFVSGNFIPFLKYVLVDIFIELYNSNFLKKDLQRNEIPIEVIESFLPTSVDPNRIYEIKFKDINFHNIYK